MKGLGVMRGSILLLLVLTLSSCSDNGTGPGGTRNPAWELQPDSVNIAVLLVDQETHTFLGGSVSHYVACEGCQAGDFPLYQLADRGEDMVIYAWLYRETDELVFSATLEFDGAGSIFYPDSFLPPQEFRVLGDSVPLPEEAKLMRGCRNVSVDECFSDGASAWAAIAPLDVVAEFADRGMSVGFFKYDSDLATKEAPATWVFFLCCLEEAGS